MSDICQSTARLHANSIHEPPYHQRCLDCRHPLGVHDLLGECSVCDALAEALDAAVIAAQRGD